MSLASTLTAGAKGASGVGGVISTGVELWNTFSHLGSKPPGPHNYNGTTGGDFNDELLDKLQHSNMTDSNFATQFQRSWAMGGLTGYMYNCGLGNRNANDDAYIKQYLGSGYVGRTMQALPNNPDFIHFNSDNTLTIYGATFKATAPNATGKGVDPLDIWDAFGNAINPPSTSATPQGSNVSPTVTTVSNAPAKSGPNTLLIIGAVVALGAVLFFVARK